MNLTKLSDEELLLRLKNFAEQDRKLQVEILWYLLEVQRRKIYLARGYASLYEYTVEELGYSHGSAYRRIQAMRLLEAVPSVAEKIEEGVINITTASQVQNFIKQETKANGSLSYKDKLKMLEEIENKSAREVEKHLITLKPENVLRSEKVRAVTAEVMEIRLMIADSLKERLDRLRFYLSHINPDMTYLGLLEYLCDRALLKFENNKSENVRGEGSSEKEGAEFKVKTRHIPSTLRHAVWMRDQGRCSYIDIASGRRCGSKYQLQVDHIHPWSLGGESTLSNLQLLCGQHNRHKGGRPSEGLRASHQ